MVHPLYKCKRVLLHPRNFFSPIPSGSNAQIRRAKGASSLTDLAKMAVQAQYISNAFSPDFHSSVEVGGGFEGLQMLQSRNHQIGQFLYASVPDSVIRDEALVPVGALTNATVVSDHPQSDLTCNVSSSCRKRRRDETIIPIAAPIYQQLCFLNPATSASIRAGTVASPNGFQVSNGLSFPAIESAAPSTSGVSSASYLPYGSDLSPDLLAILYQQSTEIETLLRHQTERLRLGMEEARNRYCRELLSSLSQRAMKCLQDKEVELENAVRKNAELEEKVRQLSAEGLIWFNLAKNNEAVVSSLRTSLEQAMIRNIAVADAVSLPAREGYGESGCSPFGADDAQSCCFETAAVSPPASGELRCRRLCKVCNEDDVCVLVLPCRHLCLCKSCHADVDTCPVCHSNKDATLQIFIS